MLKRAHWLGVAAFVTVASFAAAPLVVSGCQSTCQTSNDCGSSSFCSTANGVCLSPTAIGFCQPIPTSCAPTVMPVCGCDGKQYQNQCLAAQARVSVANVGPCATTTCGGTSQLTCADAGATTYCHFMDGVCPSRGDPTTGNCEPVPASCDGTNAAPVCGCDGKTYASNCDAQIASTNVRAQGACACGGIGNTKCAQGQYCQLPTGMCTMPNPSGVCVDVPTGACSPFSSPVCGCDGKTYTNACEAAMAQVNVAATGLCPCGGPGGVASCAPTEYCSYNTQMVGLCLIPGQLGVCEPRPTTCPGVNSPVCGCDGNDYQNSCEAAKAGTAVAIATKCPAADAGAGGMDGGADGG